MYLFWYVWKKFSSFPYLIPAKKSWTLKNRWLMRSLFYEVACLRWLDKVSRLSSEILGLWKYYCNQMLYKMDLVAVYTKLSIKINLLGVWDVLMYKLFFQMSQKCHTFKFVIIAINKSLYLVYNQMNCPCNFSCWNVFRK